MKLYSGPLSLFTGKVRVALDEKGLAHELVSVPFSRSGGYQPKHPDVLAINPKGQVPVLVDSSLALYDSTNILEYLEDRLSEPAALPEGRRGAGPLPAGRGGGRRDPVPAGLRADLRGLLQARRRARRAAHRARPGRHRPAPRRPRAPACRAALSLRRVQRRRHRVRSHAHVRGEPGRAAGGRPPPATGLVRARPRPAERGEGSRGPRGRHAAARCVTPSSLRRAPATCTGPRRAVRSIDLG